MFYRYTQYFFFFGADKWKLPMFIGGAAAKMYRLD